MDALATPLFEMDGISKRYGGVHALRDAALSVEGGRIHAILGENGAGKSTLIKIIAGVVAADSGRDGPPSGLRRCHHTRHRRRG